MVALSSLWLPILLSAVAVFFASWILHVIAKYHMDDFAKTPNEEQVRAALRPLNIPPGDYMVPRGESMESMKDPAFVEKLNQGPVLLMTVLPNGPFTMGKSLGLWFVYCIVNSVIAAYIAGAALGPGAKYLEVFRFAGCVAFTGYAMALWQDSIWHKRKVSTTIKSTLDGLVYGLLTAGFFGWLWPKG